MYPLPSRIPPAGQVCQRLPRGHSACLRTGIPSTRNGTLNLRTGFNGFSLIELLSACAIIAVLAAILIPTVSAIRDSTNRADCAGNMRQIGQALLLYAQEQGGDLPPVALNWPPAASQENTWGHAIWTYLGYAQSSFDALSNGLVSSNSYKGANIFHCKSTREKPTYAPGIPSTASGWTSYGLNDGPLYGTGLATKINPVSLSLVEQPARTVMLLESRFYWANDYAYKTQFGLLPHAGATNIVYYDGHVDTQTWPQIQTRGGQERLFWRGRGT